MSDGEIRVEVSAYELIDLPHDYLDEVYILARLREAGIPVLGTFSYRGVTSGTLYRYEHPDKPILQYLWVPPLH